MYAGQNSSVINLDANANNNNNNATNGKGNKVSPM